MLKFFALKELELELQHFNLASLYLEPNCNPPPQKKKQQKKPKKQKKIKNKKKNKAKTKIQLKNDANMETFTTMNITKIDKC